MVISRIDYRYACTWSHYIVACWEQFSAGCNLAAQHEMLSGVFQRFPAPSRHSRSEAR